MKAEAVSEFLNRPLLPLRLSESPRTYSPMLLVSERLHSLFQLYIGTVCEQPQSDAPSAELNLSSKGYSGCITASLRKCPGVSGWWVATALVGLRSAAWLNLPGREACELVLMLSVGVDWKQRRARSGRRARCTQVVAARKMREVILKNFEDAFSKGPQQHLVALAFRRRLFAFRRGAVQVRYLSKLCA